MLTQSRFNWNVWLRRFNITMRTTTIHAECDSRNGRFITRAVPEMSRQKLQTVSNTLFLRCKKCLKLETHHFRRLRQVMIYVWGNVAVKLAVRLGSFFNLILCACVRIYVYVCTYVLSCVCTCLCVRLYEYTRIYVHFVYEHICILYRFIII